MNIEAVELSRLELPLAEHFVSSHEAMTSRHVTLLRLRTDVGDGWGECSAMNSAGYAAESAASEYSFLAEVLAPSVVRSNDVRAAIARSGVGHNFAKAGVLVALLDVELHNSGESLKRYLGGVSDLITCTAVIGLGDIDTLARNLDAKLEDGYRSFKVKIVPGHDLDRLDLAIATCVGADVRVDANGSYRWDDPQHRRLLSMLAERNVAVEQPLPPGHVDWYQALRSELPMQVALDESVTSTESALQSVESGLTDEVIVKPAMLGGVDAVHWLHDACVARGTRMLVGGLIDTALSRAVNLAVASMPGFAGNSAEVTPDGRWFVETIAQDPVIMTNGTLPVPDEPGIGTAIDEEIVERYCVERMTITT